MAEEANEVAPPAAATPVAPTAHRPARIEVMDAVPVLDTARFEHMQRIATSMAHSSLIPDSLRKAGTVADPVLLDQNQVVANCFLVVNQAVRWGLDPFAVASCVSVVHGKLCYEGKLIAAVIEAKLGVHLKYAWNDATGDALAIVVSGAMPDGEILTMSGTVGEWKTTSSNSPWKTMPRMMLAYRGARDWARLHAPGLMLGVYSEDEMAGMGDDARARRAVTVSSGLAARLSGPSGGFNAQSISQSLQGVIDVNVDEDGVVTEGEVAAATSENGAPPTFVVDHEYQRAGAQAASDGEPRKAPEDASPGECKSWLSGYDAAKSELAK